LHFGVVIDPAGARFFLSVLVIMLAVAQRAVQGAQRAVQGTQRAVQGAQRAVQGTQRAVQGARARFATGEGANTNPSTYGIRLYKAGYVGWVGWNMYAGARDAIVRADAAEDETRAAVRGGTIGAMWGVATGWWWPLLAPPLVVCTGGVGVWELVRRLYE
jgi:hypothetical protein